MRLSVLFVAAVVAAADPARRALGKRKQGAKALAAMTKECRAVLSENNLDWLLEPFTCSARMRTSQTQLVLGTGLGATGTRSVAAAVDALGIPTCHRFITTADLLLNSTRHDFSAFAAASLLPPGTGRRARRRRDPPTRAGSSASVRGPTSTRLLRTFGRASPARSPGIAWCTRRARPCGSQPPRHRADAVKFDFHTGERATGGTSEPTTARARRTTNPRRASSGAWNTARDARSSRSRRRPSAGTR